MNILRYEWSWKCLWTHINGLNWPGPMMMEMFIKCAKQFALSGSPLVWAVSFKLGFWCLCSVRVCVFVCVRTTTENLNRKPLHDKSHKVKRLGICVANLDILHHIHSQANHCSCVCAVWRHTDSGSFSHFGSIYIFYCHTMAWDGFGKLPLAITHYYVGVPCGWIGNHNYQTNGYHKKSLTSELPVTLNGKRQCNKK